MESKLKKKLYEVKESIATPRQMEQCLVPLSKIKVENND